MARMVRLATSTLLALLLASGAAVAQDAYEPILDLLDRGYYASAARLEGPSLIEAFPDDPQAHFLYARALYLAGDTGEARTQLDVATEVLDGDPVPPAFIHLGGLLAASEGEAEAALGALQVAFERTGTYAFAMDWGRTAWRFGRYDVALDAYEAAAEAPGGDAEPWPHLDRGRILLLTGDPEAAVAAFQAALDAVEAAEAATPASTPQPASPAYVEAFYRLGQAYERLGDVPRARASYESARTIDPNYEPAARALAALEGN